MVAAIGVLLGLSVFTFSYAEGLSYLQDDPSACVNCHIMREQFDAWNRSSHKAVAVCNDCHASHTFPNKWIVKGLNGFNHSLAFTTGSFPDPIRIRPFNVKVAQANCVECHHTLVDSIHDEDRPCTACHGNVGHSSR
jgi:cytochrome c nitrite reductase small subunit